MTEQTTYAKLKSVELELDQKGRFNYASWADVWEEVIKYDDKANYEVHEKDGFPIFYNKTGGMVKVSVTIKDVTRTMWLPIMDYNNRAKKIDTIDTMDINKSIQRCLVKCIAMFGLGLYVYKGEDIPSREDGDFSG